MHEKRGFYREDVEEATGKEGWDFVQAKSLSLSTELQKENLVVAAFKAALEAGYTGEKAVLIGIAIAFEFFLHNSRMEDCDGIVASFDLWANISKLVQVVGSMPGMIMIEPDSGLFHFADLFRQAKQEVPFSVN